MSKWVSALACVLLLASAGYCVDSESTLRDARALVKAGNLQPAIEKCNTVLETRPVGPIEPRVRLFLGNLLTKAGRPPADALEQFARIANDFPNSPEAPEALLRIGYLRDRNKQDPAEWQQIVKSYPRTKEAAEALKCLGHVALRNGDPELAIKRFDASATVPEADSALAMESRIEGCYARISRYWKNPEKSLLVGAQQAFRQGLILSAGSASQQKTASDTRLHLGLGEVYLIQGFGEKAAQEYQAVLDQNPTDAYVRGVARYGLGCALYAKGAYADAVSVLDALLKEQSGDSLAAKARAWKQVRPGYSSLAVTDPEKAKGLSGLELVPDAAYWKAASLVELKQYAEAKSVLDELSSIRGLKSARRIQRMQAICVLGLGEGK